MLNSQTWLQGVLKTQTSKTQTSDLENADLENTDLKLKCRPWKYSARNIKCQIESEQNTFRGLHFRGLCFLGLCFWSLWSAFSRSAFSRHPMATSSTTKYIPVYSRSHHFCGTLHIIYSLCIKINYFKLYKQKKSELKNGSKFCPCFFLHYRNTRVQEIIYISLPFAKPFDFSFSKCCRIK